MAQSKKKHADYMRRRRADQKALKIDEVSPPASSTSEDSSPLESDVTSASGKSLPSPNPAAVPFLDPYMQEVRQKAIDKEKAVETAMRTESYFEKRGWCLWRCSKLNNEVLVIVKDEKVTGYPPNLPVFTDAELKEFNQKDIPLSTYRLIIDAKKADLVNA